MANNNSGRDKNEKDLVCSFCGKHQDEVERMIIGPGVNICSECIGLCHDLLSDKPERPSGSRAPRAGAGRTRSLQAADDLNINIMTPAEIYKSPFIKCTVMVFFSRSTSRIHSLIAGRRTSPCSFESMI